MRSNGCASGLEGEQQRERPEAPRERLGGRRMDETRRKNDTGETPRASNV